MVLLHERYVLARVRQPQVKVDGLLPYERAVYRGHRWWTLGELRATEETVKPDGFANLLEPTRAGRLPAAPLDIL